MTDALLDVIGIGLGPANLGVAVAVEESRRLGHTIHSLFLDRREHFDWHPDMLLTSSVMQISYLKDLVTQRDPTSSFSFTNYLHSTGRLNDFINRQTFFPSRAEFTAYLGWVAERLTVDVRWSTTVDRIDLADGGAVCRVHGTRAGERFVARGRNVVLGVGARPVLPDWAAPVEGARVFHNARLRTALQCADLGQEVRVAVVGQGQSAAEVMRHVLETIPGATVECLMSGYGLVPADDSPFANRVFDPEAVDDFYFAPPNVRDTLLERHRTTNYGCVDPNLIGWLSEFEYAGKVAGTARLTFRRATRVLGATEDSRGVALVLYDGLADRRATERFDLVICATGFRSGVPVELLGDGFDGGGSIQVERDYRVAVRGRPTPVFVVGSTDSGHGLGSGLLSNVAIRSGEVVASIERARRGGLDAEPARVG